MHEDFRPRVFIAGEVGSEARGDALALTAALAERAEAVTVVDAADLIVIGAAGFDPTDLTLLEGFRSPVAVAPRGQAGRRDYEVRRIDVAIDGGRGADVALATAVRLALAHSSRLRLVAVAEFGFNLGGAARPADPRERERLARHLDQATDALTGVRIETELREGLADQIILGLAREADLLVLGSRAAFGTVGRVALGSVGARVLRAATCPTLVAPAA